MLISRRITLSDTTLRSRTRSLNTAIVAAGTLASRLLGVVKARAIASAFGSGMAADAINFAYNMPNNLRKLFAEGSMSTAFLPFYERADEQEKGRLLGSLIVFQTLLMVPIAVFAYLFRFSIIALLSGFTDPSQISLAGSLLGPFMAFLFLISLCSSAQTALQCKRLFLVQAVAPLLFSLSVILSVSLLTPAWGAWSMAFGTVLGSLLQTAAVLLRLKRSGLKIRLSLGFTKGPFLDVLKAWIPASASCLLAVLSQQFAFSIASTMPSGTVTAFSNSLIFWQTPYGIFFTAVGTVFFPDLASSSGIDKARHLAEGSRKLFTYLVPSAIIVFALRKETVCSVLQSGSFTLKASLLTAQALSWYLGGMIIVALNSFLQRLCFASNMYWTSLALSLSSTAVDIASTLVMAKLGLGIITFPIATILSSLASLVLTYFLVVRKTLKEFSLLRWIKGLARPALASLCLGAIAAAYMALDLRWHESGSSMINLIKLAGCYLASLLIVLGLFKAFRIEILPRARAD